jgi:hypothetical protein
MHSITMTLALTSNTSHVEICLIWNDSRLSLHWQASRFLVCRWVHAKCLIRDRYATEHVQVLHALWKIRDYNKHKQTEIMYQPAPGTSHQAHAVTVKNQPLADVEKFTYHGSTLSRCVHIDDEINARIAKAITAFGRLRSSVLERRGISTVTKVKVTRRHCPSITPLCLWNMDCLPRPRKEAQPLPSELTSENTDNQVTGHIPWHCSTLQGQVSTPFWPNPTWDGLVT